MAIPGAESGSSTSSPKPNDTAIFVGGNRLLRHGLLTQLQTAVLGFLQ
jgi:hypothetical protein